MYGRMLSAVTMQSLYLEPHTVPGMPPHCQVVDLSPFMRSLTAEAVNLPLAYRLKSRHGALMELIRHEIRAMASCLIHCATWRIVSTAESHHHCGGGFITKLAWWSPS